VACLAKPGLVVTGFAPGVSFMGVLFCVRLLSVVFKPAPTLLVNVEFKSVLSLDAPRAVYAPLPSTPLILVRVLEPDLTVDVPVNPILLLEFYLLRPVEGVPGSAVARAVTPPSLELDPDLVMPGLSAAVVSFLLFKVEFKFVLEAVDLSVLLRPVLAATPPVFLEVAVVLPTTDWRYLRSSAT
jgi:hypothetical protein